MARESQGLQVLLILFVMLCVGLGVTLYLKIKTADEAAKAAVAATQAKQQAEQATEAVQRECETLKGLIGMPGASTDEVVKKTNEYMTTYGSAKQSDADAAKGDKPLFDPGTLFYARLLESMFKTIQDRNDELVRARVTASELKMKLTNHEANAEKTLAKVNEGEQGLVAVMETIKKDFNEQIQTSKDTTSSTLSKLTTVTQRTARQVEEAKAEAQSERKKTEAVEKDVDSLAKQLHGVTAQEMTVPSGEITWVSLPNRMVWINRGRADSLQRQTKFTVYSSDSNMGATAKKKGTVEVVRIDGDHTAQARILDDQLADPIMVGDKVFTPLWSPGQQNHFALTGIMNLDGDGRNQLSVVRGLITQSGGVVDCELDEQGHKQGQITAQTRFLVLGDAPDKSSRETMTNHGDILRDAERLKLQTLRMSDFKQQMGYHKSSSVEHFGAAGASSNDVSRATNALKSKAASKSDAAAGQ